MAYLNPIADCKVTDPNAFLTALNVGTVNNVNVTNSYYNRVNVNNITWLRVEQLTKVFIQINTTISQASKILKVALTNYKSCTVTSANPALVTITSHGYTTGDKVRFSAATIPTGMILGLQYFVNVQSLNTFWIYDTQANAIAGGATGRVATTSTGTTVVCHKVIEEKDVTLATFADDFYTGLSTGIGVSVTSAVTGWTTVVDTTASKWAIIMTTDDTTINTYGTTLFSSYGTTTASAVSGTDSFILDKCVDFSAGWTLASFNVFAFKTDTWLKPNFLVDPTQSSFASLTIPPTAAIFTSTSSGMCFGKPLSFTTNLGIGDTSATLINAFNGVTGTYKTQLFPRTGDDDFVQIDMSFTNGSTAVTFSALTYNHTDRGAVVIPKSSNYRINLTTSYTNYLGNSYSTVNSIFAEEDREVFAYLTTGISTGSTSMTVDRNTGWSAGDTFKIGGESTTGALDNTTYTISTVTAGVGTDTITFSPALVGTNRVKMANVHIVAFVNTAFDVNRVAGTPTFILSTGQTTAIFNVIGVPLTKFSINPNGTYNKKTYGMPYYVNKVYNGSFSFFLSELGSFMYRVAMDNFYTPFYCSLEQANKMFIRKSSYYKPSLMFSTPLYSFDIKDVRSESSSPSPDIIQGDSVVAENLYFYKVNPNNPALSFTNFFSNSVRNIYIDGAGIGLIPISGLAKIQNVYFGTNSPNIYDVGFNNASAFSRIEINNTNIEPTASVTNLALGLSPISSFAVTDMAGVNNNTRIFYKYGESSISGSALADTTSRVGNQMLFFKSYSGTTPTYWTQTIPTGNIQNKDMMVGVWCKLDNSAYWAGTHQMPRLTITYDNGTEVYAEAGQTTDWQFLFVPFTPTTDFGFVDAKLSIQSNATFANTKVYFGDMSVLYPAGYTLNLGAFNYLNAGLPVSPTISTSVSAQDVWAADPKQFGASTVGDKVNKIKKIVTGLQ
jgi:hypothetical protein